MADGIFQLIVLESRQCSPWKGGGGSRNTSSFNTSFNTISLFHLVSFLTDTLLYNVYYHHC